MMPLLPMIARDCDEFEAWRMASDLITYDCLRLPPMASDCL